MKSVTLIESDTNELGLEVRHERDERNGEHLRAYRNGHRMAERRVHRKMVLPNFSNRHTDYFGALQPWVCVALDAALDEGLRLLRDGRGLGADT